MSASGNSPQYNCDNVPAWLCPEGYARVTRDGKTDVYCIVNEETLVGEGVCFATAMDDYDPENLGRSYGRELVLHHSDWIEFLGDTGSYFGEGGEFWHLTKQLASLIPESAGLLPKVRAVEMLKRHPNEITESAVQSAATLAYLDYVQRRAALTVAMR